MQIGSRSPTLEELGYTPHFHNRYLALIADSPDLEGSVPARIVSDHGTEYELAGPLGLRRGLLSRRLLEAGDLERPCIGDFVVAQPIDGSDVLRVRSVLERTSVFRRKVAGGTSAPQAIAANVDVAIVVSALADEQAGRHVLNRAMNARRIERYLRAVAEAPARAVVVVTKSDLRSDAAERAEELSAELGGIDVVLTSGVTGQGLDELGRHLGPGVTAVLVGSSGVGKSTLTNRLLGREVQRVSALREADARGRHTTTHRALFVLPGGGLLIDTPGMRELALFASDETDTEQSGFDDIDALAVKCRFRDCRHQGEPGCAVQQAVETGELSVDRLEHSHALRRELEWQKRRYDEAARRLARQRSRALSRAQRARSREKR